MCKGCLEVEKSGVVIQEESFTLSSNGESVDQMPTFTTLEWFSCVAIEVS